MTCGLCSRAFWDEPFRHLRGESSRPSEGLTGHFAAIVARHVSKGEFHLGKPARGDTEGVNAQTHQDSGAVRVAGHLSAHADLPLASMGGEKDALDHAEDASVQHEGRVGAPFTSNDRE